MIIHIEISDLYISQLYNFVWISIAKSMISESFPSLMHIFFTEGQGCVSWWRHQMETFSALLAICAGNSPVTGEFPTQRPVTRSFDVYFDLRPNERLSKQSWGWWFETLSSPLWRQRNVKPNYYYWWIIPSNIIIRLGSIVDRMPSLYMPGRHTGYRYSYRSVIIIFLDNVRFKSYQLTFLWLTETGRSISVSNRPSLFPIMANHRFDAMPLYKPMMV